MVGVRLKTASLKKGVSHRDTLTEEQAAVIGSLPKGAEGDTAGVREYPHMQSTRDSSPWGSSS